MAAGALLVIAIAAAVGRSNDIHVDLARLVASAWLAAALASCVIALCQYFGWAHRFAPFMNVPADFEAYGNLRQRNQFAALGAIGMAALLWWVARGLAMRLAVPAGLLLAAGVAASASRTGAVQLAALLLLALLWRGPSFRRQFMVCVLGLAAYLVAVLALPLAQQSVVGAQNASVLQRLASDLGCSSRKVLWSNIADLIAQRPWTGWGWGELDYAHYSHSYAGARFCDILDNAHNLPLHLAVELGVPVALILGAGLLAWVVVARPWRETDSTRQMAWSILLLLALHSAVEYPLWYGPFQIALGLSVGLTRRHPAAVRLKSWEPVVARGCALLLAASAAYATWDYHRVSQIYLAPDARGADYQDDALAAAQRSWLFRNQARFAELTITAPERSNAAQMYALAGDLLHYSPEPRVIERRIESALLLGNRDEAAAQAARYRAAFPSEHAAWSRAASASR